MFVFRHIACWFGAKMKISSNKILRYQIMNLEMKGVLWKTFKVWFTLTLIRSSVVAWDRFPMLNNLWRFVSLKDFPSTIFVCPLWFYFSFSGVILITEILSACSTLVLLSSACRICAHDAGLWWLWYQCSWCGSTCLSVAGGGEALLPEQSSENVWRALDSMTGLWDGENSGSFIFPHLVDCCLLSGLSGLSLSHLTVSLAPFAQIYLLSVPSQGFLLIFLPQDELHSLYSSQMGCLHSQHYCICSGSPVEFSVMWIFLCLPCSVFPPLECRPLLSAMCQALPEAGKSYQLQLLAQVFEAFTSTVMTLFLSEIVN